jgi:branched-chain amino acid transport system substrate-binding protein
LSLAAADSTLFSDPTAAAASQGVYYSSDIPPLDTNNSASMTLETNIKATDPSYVMGTYPTQGVIYAYLSGALAVQGLQAAGPNPTRKSYIASLSAVTNWTANGLLGGPVSLNHFGTSEKSYCTFFVHVVGKGFVHVPGGNGTNGAFCQTLPANL